MMFLLFVVPYRWNGKSIVIDKYTCITRLLVYILPCVAVGFGIV